MCPVLAASEKGSRGNLILATITLPALGGNPQKVLYLSNRAYVDAAGLRWDPIIREPPGIDHGGSYLETDVQMVDAVLGLMNYRISGQAPGERLSSLTKLYRFIGADVHIQQGFVGTTDLRTLLQGEIAEIDSLKARTMDLHVVQDRKYDVDVPPRTVEKATHPYAPKDVIGTPIPIPFGNWQTLRENDSTFNSPAYRWGLARGPHGMVPVESERSGGDVWPLFIVSDKELKSAGADHYIYESSLNQYAKCYTPPVSSNPAGGPSTSKLADRRFVVCVLPATIHASTTATGGAECIREDKDLDLSGPAVLDWNAGLKLLKLTLPEVQGLGDIEEMEILIAYTKNASSATHPRFGFITDGDALITVLGAGSQYQSFGAAAVGSPTVPGATAVMVVNLATFGTWEQFRTTHLVCEVMGAGQVMYVHRLVCLPRYRANATIVKPGLGGGIRRALKIDTPDETTFDAKQFTYPQGVPDRNHLVAADGTYTGTAGLLIEHPVDLAHWALRELGGVAAGGVRTADYGNFPDARTALAGYKVFGALRGGQKLSDFLADLSEQTLCWYMRMPTEPGNPWIAIPWGINPALDYRTAAELFTFQRTAGHIAIDTFQPLKTRVSAVRNVVRVNYDWDPVANTYADQLFISDTGSRVYSGGVFTTDAGRVTTAAASVLACGRKVKTLNLRLIKDPFTASSVLTRYFDLMALPKPGVRFQAFVQAYDLNRGHVVAFDADWDARFDFPREGSDGSWAGKRLRVVSVRRLKGSAVRHEVEAVEAY